jgi:hypothetical protein
MYEPRRPAHRWYFLTGQRSRPCHFGALGAVEANGHQEDATDAGEGSTRMAKRGKQKKRNAVLMAVFGVAMLAGSLVMCYMLYVFFRDGRDMQHWMEVPATIMESELVRSKSRSPGSRPGSRRTQYSVKATYSYTVDGRGYIGDRVSILSISGNFSPSHFRRQAALLEHHRETGEPFPCFVNPGDHGSSILFPDPPLYQAGVITCFALVFFTLGFGGTAASIKYRLEKTTGEKSAPIRVYDALFGVTLTIAQLLIAVPITYFTYLELSEGASLRQAAWFIPPLLVVLGALYGLKKTFEQKRK